RGGVAWESPPPTKITASKAASTRIALRANVPSLISFKVIVLLFRSYVGFHLGVLGRRISPAGACSNRARGSNAGVHFRDQPLMPNPPLRVFLRIQRFDRFALLFNPRKIFQIVPLPARVGRPVPDPIGLCAVK